MIIERWPEIKDKLNDRPIYTYPFPRSLLHIITGKNKTYSHAPTIRTLNKVIDFMKWDYLVKARCVNDNICPSKEKSLLDISNKFDHINWAKESDHIFYFFKDTYMKGYISDIYPAPGDKTLSRLLSIIKHC